MSKVEYRAVIKFLTKEGLAPTAIKRLDGVYGEASPSYSTVKEWAKQFRLGRESVTRPVGRPKHRWEDDVRNDLRKLKLLKRTEQAQDRHEWKKIVEKAKTLHKL